MQKGSNGIANSVLSLHYLDVSVHSDIKGKNCICVRIALNSKLSYLACPLDFPV